MPENVNEKKTKEREAGTKSAFDKAKEIVDARSASDLKFFKIGKPSAFSMNVDPRGRIQEYIESKMSVIDLIPCDYLFPLAKALVAKDKEGKINVLDALTPAISYEQAIDRFQIISGIYGLPTGYGGLRLYLTDETTSTDEFSSSYTDNILKSSFNAAVDKTKTFRDIGRSVTSAYDELAREVGEQVGTTAGGFVETIAGAVGLDINAKGLGSAIGGAIAAGNKISLPKLWSDSSYSPNMSAVVKLVSPYGHPSAIKEFIIKPLMFLIIMAAARTADGISYGQSPKLTVKGYGIGHLPLAHISSISLRRGGSDTSYNIYRQPLSVDVSISFQSLMDGFAVFTKKTTDNKNKDVFKGTDQIVADHDTAEAGQKALFPTLGTLVDSLRPIAINHIVEKHNISALPKDPGLQLSGREEASNKKSPNLFSSVPPQPTQRPVINMDDRVADANKVQASETAKSQIGETPVDVAKKATVRETIVFSKVHNPAQYFAPGHYYGDGGVPTDT